jgi:hypothetical protein
VIVALLYPALVAVSQTATDSLSGRVMDLMGILIPQAKVLATRRSDPPVTFETKTDDSGKFTFTNLPPDVYQVSVTREDVGTTIERTVSIPRNRTVLLDIQFSIGCDDVSEPAGAISDDEKAEVFRSTLAQATDSRLALLDQKQRETGAVLSTQNIKPDWVPALRDLRIQLLTPDQIQRKADSQGDFLFLSMPEMKIRSQCIAVMLSNNWANGKASKNLNMSGGAFAFEYRKESGKWVGKSVGNWVF